MCKVTDGFPLTPTDSQGLMWMSDSDLRTGTFHQQWVTAGDTACSVNGVQGTIGSKSKHYIIYTKYKVTEKIFRHSLIQKFNVNFQEQL